MRPEKVLKFKGIGHRTSGTGHRKKEILLSVVCRPPSVVCRLLSYSDALDCFEYPFVYGLSGL